MNTLMREALNSYLQRIKSVFPTFQRFGVGSDAFDADELDYKWELIRLFQSTVAGRLVAAHTTRSMPDDVADSLIKMFAAPSHGSRQNLVDWRYTEAIEKRITAAGKTQFATLAAKLLYGSDDTESRVDDFVHDLWLLLDGAGQKIDSWPAATRSITSYLLMCWEQIDLSGFIANELSACSCGRQSGAGLGPKPVCRPHGRLADPQAAS